MKEEIAAVWEEAQLDPGLYQITWQKATFSLAGLQQAKQDVLACGNAPHRLEAEVGIAVNVVNVTVLDGMSDTLVQFLESYPNAGALSVSRADVVHHAM